MDGTIFKDLTSNVALLLSMSIVYEIQYFIPKKLKSLIPYINGCLISVLCIGVMSMPFELTPGLFFDTRTIMLGVTAIIFGRRSTVIAVCATSAYRLILGGVGGLVGVLTIVSSAGIGLAWRSWSVRKAAGNRWLHAYLVGIAIHVTMLACMTALPWPLAMKTLSKLALPVMLIYPAGTVLLSMLLMAQKDRHASALRVAEAEERYRSLFEHSPAIMFILDPDDGSIFDANPAASRFYGWPQDEMRRMKIMQINISKPDVILRSMSESKGQQQNYFLFKHRKADGEIVDVEVYSGPIFIHGKTLLYSIVHDVTARIAADYRLQQSESRLQSAQAMANVGNWEQDLSTGLVWASQECFAIYGFGYDPAHPYLPLGKAQAVTNEDRPALDRAMLALVEKNAAYDVEFRIRRATDGELRHLHSIARLERGQDGSPAKVVGVIQDITGRKLAEEELARSESKHREMIANIADVIAVLDRSGAFRYISPNIEKWFGWGREELIGAPGWSIIHPEDQQVLIATFTGLLGCDKAAGSAQCRCRKKDGAYRAIELTAINLTGDPIIGGVLVNFRDVTERQLAQLEYGAMLQAAMDGFCVVNEEGRFLEVNDAYCAMVGYSREELLGMTLAGMDAAIRGENIPGALMIDGRARFETRHRRKSGPLVDVEISCNVVPGISGRICVILRDITDRKRHEDEVVYLNCHDALTGLHNRTFFEEELRREDAAGRLPLSVIMGDINGLKLTNDIFGHMDGDKLLVAIASILKSCCRKDGIVARVGGDEFNILLPGTDRSATQSICERIYQACEASEIMAGGRPFHPSISLGCATKTANGQPIEGILKDAEDSMYKRKLLERKSMHSSLVSSIKATMLEKSHETNEHADRLISLCKAIGQKMNLSGDQINELELLAALHDIGKIGIDDRLLTSPFKLNEDEWKEMRKHPEIGYRIALASPELVSIANCILYHHERWDGKGYPQKLKGEKIPLLARIITVVDAFDAMTSDRPYRKAMPKEKALEEIRSNAGGQFDPEVVRLFLETVA